MASSESPIRLIVLFGGRSAEHDVSCISAAEMIKAADKTRFDIVPIGITKDGKWVLDEATVKALESSDLPDSLMPVGPPVNPFDLLREATDATTVVFPLTHGPFGEDGTLQGLLEQVGVPYVGAGVLGSAIAMDKVMAKEVFAQAGIPQAKHLSYRDTEITEATANEVEQALGFPVFVKPANLGSSVGVSKASNADELRSAIDLAAGYDEWIVIEEAVNGREIECAVLGEAFPEASFPGEIRSNSGFYDYAEKYVDRSADLIIPADLPDDVTVELRSIAIQAYKALRIEGLGRVDFFYEEGGRGLMVNEVNTLPGFTPVSMYPAMWAATGLDYPSLINRLVALALERHERRAGRIGRSDH